MSAATTKDWLALVKVFLLDYLVLDSTFETPLTLALDSLEFGVLICLWLMQWLIEGPLHYMFLTVVDVMRLSWQDKLWWGFYTYFIPLLGVWISMDGCRELMDKMEQQARHGQGEATGDDVVNEKEGETRGDRLDEIRHRIEEARKEEGGVPKVWLRIPQKVLDHSILAFIFCPLVPLTFFLFHHVYGDMKKQMEKDGVALAQLTQALEDAEFSLARDKDEEEREGQRENAGWEGHPLQRLGVVTRLPRILSSGNDVVMGNGNLAGVGGCRACLEEMVENLKREHAREVEALREHYEAKLKAEITIGNNNYDAASQWRTEAAALKKALTQSTKVTNNYARYLREAQSRLAVFESAEQAAQKQREAQPRLAVFEFGQNTAIIPSEEGGNEMMQKLKRENAREVEAIREHYEAKLKEKITIGNNYYDAASQWRTDAEELQMALEHTYKELDDYVRNSEEVESAGQEALKQKEKIKELYQSCLSKMQALQTDKGILTGALQMEKDNAAAEKEKLLADINARSEAMTAADNAILFLEGRVDVLRAQKRNWTRLVVAMGRALGFTPRHRELEVLEARNCRTMEPKPRLYKVASQVYNKSKKSEEKKIKG